MALSSEVIAGSQQGEPFRINSLYKVVVPSSLVAMIVPFCTGYGSVGNILLTYALLLSSRASKFTLYLTCFVFIAVSIYIPVGFNFGKLSSAYVSSAIQTNRCEAGEFLSGLGVAPVGLMLLSIIMLLVHAVLSGVISCKTRVRYFTLFLFAIISLNAYPVRMLTNAVKYYYQSVSALNDLTVQASIPDNFTLLSSKPRYVNNIVIIGESVSAEYLSLYGYTHNTTPWLNTAPGYFLSNYVSAAPLTYLSLPRTLAVSNGHSIEQNNSIVALANKAGFNTVWISNQGYIGEYDTPSTMIASKAKSKHFLKNSDYDSKNTDDFDMLKMVNQSLADNGKKVIFVHMIGSHPDPCRRLNGFQGSIRPSGSEKFNCYLASINKLDEFVRQTVQMLKSSGKTYSLVYFSDHGMTVDQSKIAVRQGNEYKQNYKVPFFILTSDQKEHAVIDAPVSAYSFISIFEWLTGIRTKQIPAKSLEQVSDNDIKVFNGTDLISFAGLPGNRIYH